MPLMALQPIHVNQTSFQPFFSSRLNLVCLDNTGIAVCDNEELKGQG